ncbi:phage virion morphogenesis protein [Leptolyngbya sp. FACHB-541]|uniref:phage virion morphogenesis protein n=1 Tax=Leptolyngbya sp. FACHB-541 TaxID=2692810 RepID=UPI001685A519|nr:phage virion morphogenesis protein [Leptolyngbya sp. FACHB-541]MBD1995307.1 phage virion morphogenesis protein [Leptolyngbya sp. FACHB-541]
MTEPIFSMEYDDQQVRSLLGQLERNLGNLYPVMADIGEEVLADVDESFETETDPYGIRWEPLSAYTLSFKAQNTRILKILQSTGRMRSSITYQATASRVVIGTNVKYARKHQLGRGVPRRQFLGVGPRLRVKIVVLLREHITDLDI